MSTNNQGNNDPADTQDCIGHWESELGQVNDLLLQAEAECAKFSIAYANAGEWQAKLEAYWNNIQLTDQLVNNISQELQLFSGQSTTICDNMEYMEESIRLLFCIFQDASRDLDCIWQKLNDSITQIECLNNAGIEGGQSLIMRCMEDLQEQVGLAMDLRNLAMVQILQTWESICMLKELLCAPCFGLSAHLDQLIDLFGKPIGNPHNCKPEPVVDTKSCTESLEHKPMLPPNCDPYYAKTQTQYENAVKDLVTCKDAYDKARDKKETLLTCSNSLTDAIMCAKAAKVC